ncbi:MAG: low affinity iron permease family protein [Kofleriaceae bacterium]
MTDYFRGIARKVATAVGSPYGFAIAFVGVIIWLLSGPAFHYSDTWQLVINTSTTIVTFLMVFLIQNSQNHDSRALHLKLDELIRAVSEARTGLVDLENLPEAELRRLEGEFQKLRVRPERSAS